MKIANADTAALLLVDIQPDFMPGGGLAVADGDAIVAPVRELMTSDQFRCCVATQDWHPPGHISFASSHPGRKPFESIPLHGHPQTLWPDHCVQNSPGAELHPDLPAERIDAIIRKGADAAVDSYSGFRNNWNAAGERPPTGLAGYLRERGIDTLYLCGLARDVCVAWTAEDGAAAGFAVYCLWELTRPVDPASGAAVRRRLTECGVRIV
ncbi:MAG TPA: nicotinamidase [Gammaproteobacteria bacterium]|nr:nicotinamidase [Gammaproteobacteria bacterium]